MRPFIALTGREETTGRSLYYAAPAVYFRAVERAGGCAFCASLSGDGADVLARADGLLLTGGGDVDAARFGQIRHPENASVSFARDECEIELARAFFAAGKPILAICRGMQVLAVALGGTLHQHLPDLPGVTIDHSDYAVRHAVRLSQGSRLREVYRREVLSVNSTHHQAVDRLPDGFCATAVSPDGVTEAIEGGGAIGVQWHPERIARDGHAVLFEDFVGRCAGR